MPFDSENNFGLPLFVAKAGHHAELWDEMTDICAASVDVTARGANNQKRLASVADGQIPAFLEILHVRNFTVLFLDEKSVSWIPFEVHVVDSIRFVVVFCHYNLSHEFTANSLLK